MEEKRSRSPSPAPPPPTPSAPGPRAAALQKLYHDAITHVLKTCSYANFAACFPTPARAAPGVLHDAHEQFIGTLDHWLRREFDSVLVARDVVPSLNELDRLIDDARRRKAQAVAEGQEEGRTTSPTPPHALPPSQLYISRLAPTLGMFEQQMRQRQEALAEENQQLLERVQQQRKDINALIGGLENVARDLAGSVEAMQPEQLDALREASRDADQATR